MDGEPGLVIRHDDRHRFVLAGDLDIASAPMFEEAVRRGADPPLSVDLSGVEFMDCAGLGALVRAGNNAKDRGIGFAIVGVSPPVARLLAATRFAAVLAAPRAVA